MAVVIMLLGVLKILTVWLPLLVVCLRLLPLTGPGRVTFCLGFSGLWSLLFTGVLMWVSLVMTGMILPWLPVGMMALVAVLLIWRVTPHSHIITMPRPAQSLGSLSRIIIIGLLVLIALRLATLLPDVALRPLAGWDAAVVWAYEARVWFEAGHYVEFLPPEAWLSAPADAWVSMTAVEYPRLVSALILWMATAGDGWTGVGPGLVWWAAMVFTTLMLFGLLCLLGLSKLWALGGAYLWSSLPMISAHVALYGYADVWMACVFASVMACLLLAIRSTQVFWWVLTWASLSIMPLIKVEGAYWLVVGAAAILLGRFWFGMRPLVLLAGVAVIGIWLLEWVGWDVFNWMTLGRLSFDAGDWGRSLLAAADHALLWFDWHLLFYLTFGLVALTVVRPKLVQPYPALAATVVLSLMVIWVFIPLTVAGDWFVNGTLFSRIGLHISAPLSVFCILISHRFWQEYTADAQ